MTVISGPGELVALVPTLIGFQPRDSVLVVLVRDEGRIATVMRLDVSDLLSDDADEIGAALAREAVIEGARVALVLGFTEDRCAGPLAIDEVVAALSDSVGTVEGWLVAGGRYYCASCTDPGCCPPGGRAVPEPGDEASRVLGLAARRRDPGASRAPARERRGCAAAARRSERRAEADVVRWRAVALDEWLTAIDRGVDGAAGLGRLAAGLGDVRVRDAVLLALIPGAEDAVEDALDGTDSAAITSAIGAGMRPSRPPDPVRAVGATDLLHALLEHAPRRLLAPAAGTLAVLAWWQGAAAEARAWCAIALDHDPTYRLAILTLALVDSDPGGH